MRKSPFFSVFLSPIIAGTILFCSGCQPNRGPIVPAATTQAVDFENVTASSGIRYPWTINGKRPLNLLQTIGNGCAFLDYNNDGNLDVLLIGPYPGLFKGNGKGQFTDVTPLLGGVHGYLLGCAIGDIDGNSFPDIYLSGYRDGRLLHNRGGKGFDDITASAGLSPQPWGTSCAFVETKPGSGKLDLLIANYARFGPEPGIKQLCSTYNKQGKMVQTSCGPRDYEPLKVSFFRNVGGLHFIDASLSAGFETTNGRGLGIAACPIDPAQPPVVAVANDEIGGDLLRWENDKVRNVSDTSGVAYDRNGNVHGGMGVAWGDYDNDGAFDLVVATYQAEPKSIYHNDGAGLFTDVSYAVGVGAPTLPSVAFGTTFFDFNNDGWLDLVFSNGHVQDNIEDIAPKSTYRQSTQLFQNQGKQANGQVRFADVSARSPALCQAIVGRGLATGDFDNDGRVDLLVVDSEGQPLLLHNQTPQPGHWLGLRLIGTKSNRDGYGAIVTLEVGDKKWVRFCHADGSYLSSSDPRVHFGLGTEKTKPKLTIHWPSGRTEIRNDVVLDRYTNITEGSNSP